MRFDAVAFDLDGTLYPNASLYSLAWPSMLLKARAFTAFSEARDAMRRRGLRRDLPHPGNSAEFRELQAAFVAEKLGMRDAAKTATLIDRCFYRGVEEFFDKVRPYRGMKEALVELGRAGLRLALLSDLPPARKLELMGLTGRFEAALCSEDSGFLKPARAPFQMLASALGLPPERILYVGNSKRIDVRGAKAAGLSAAIVSRRPAHEADLSFYDWRKLVKFALC
jgi:putative hydrolase of the HAD superfamily